MEGEGATPESYVDIAPLPPSVVTEASVVMAISLECASLLRMKKEKNCLNSTMMGCPKILCLVMARYHIDQWIACNNNCIENKN